MAEKEATLIIKLIDQVTPGLKKLNDKIKAGIDVLDNYKYAMAAIGAAIGAVVAASYAAIKAYAEEESVVNKLNQAIKNQGLEVESTTKEYQDFASALQKTTAFEDGAIMETMALLTTFGLAGDTLKKTTTAALDLSQSLGIDLKSATMLLGKAAVGETSSLSRYGIVISEGTPKAEKLAAALDQVNARFGGSAQAALATVEGKMANINNRLGDMVERIGKQLLPIFDYWMSKVEAVTGFLERMSGATDNELKGRELTIDALKRERDAIIEAAKSRGSYHEGVVRLSDEEQKRIMLITDAINKEKERMAVEEKAVSSSQERTLGNQAFLDALAAEEEAKRQEKLDKEIEQIDKQTADLMERFQTKEQTKLSMAQYYSGQHLAVVEKHLSEDEKKTLAAQVKKLKDHGKFTEAQLLLDQAYIKAKEDDGKKHQKWEELTNEQRISNFTATMNQIATLSTAKNREIRIIGKAGALASAYMNTAEAVTRALAAAPPPFNFALAAAVGAAGGVQIAKIAGVELAEGGIVQPRPGGTQATIGEAGKAEAVIPLDDERAREKMGGLFGNNITIQAGVIVADNMSVQEFAVKIDEALYRLQRNRNSVAF